MGAESSIHVLVDFSEISLTLASISSIEVQIEKTQLLKQLGFAEKLLFLYTLLPIPRYKNLTLVWYLCPN